MFYVFKHTITTDDIVTAKKTIKMPLTKGVIHQVDFLFADGCDHEANIQVFLANFQLWPSNRGATLTGNATVVSFRDFIELEEGGTNLEAKVWGDGTIDDVDVIIQIGLLPKKVLMPLSFDELLKAVRGY